MNKRDYSELTEIESLIFRYIVKHKREHDGNSPTLREIMDKCKVSSTSVATYYLRNLEQAGLILVTGKNRSRSIEVNGGSWDYNCPVMP